MTQQAARARRSELRIVDPAAALQTEHQPRRCFQRIALVGNPNVGKSVIFGALTGAYATVSNYPGTTVEVTRAIARADATVTSTVVPG